MGILGAGLATTSSGQAYCGRGKVWKFWGEARVGDEVAAEAEYAAMIITPDDQRRRPGAAA